MSELAALADRVDEAWRAIAFIAAWSGISVGVLVSLAVEVYLDPALRTICVRIGLAVLLAYGILMYGFHAGAADKQAEWDGANAVAAAEAARRDAAAAAAAKASEAQLGAEIQINSTNDQRQLDALIKADAVCHPISADELR